MKISQIIRTSSVALALAVAVGITNPPAFGHDAKGTAAKTASTVPATYPLKKCVVSDDPLGEHGKPVKVTTPEGTDVYLCCKDCVKDFKKNPEKYGKMVTDAQAKK